MNRVSLSVNWGTISQQSYAGVIGVPIGQSTEKIFEEDTCTRAHTAYM